MVGEEDIVPAITVEIFDDGFAGMRRGRCSPLEEGCRRLREGAIAVIQQDLDRQRFVLERIEGSAQHQVLTAITVEVALPDLEDDVICHPGARRAERWRAENSLRRCGGNTGEKRRQERCAYGKIPATNMRIVYLVQLSRPILLEDFWPIPFIGGQLVPVAKDGQTTGFEITFSRQPADYAPRWDQTPSGRSKGTLHIRDKLIAFVRFQLRDAFTYLQCLFDIDVEIDEIETRFFAETIEEEASLTLRSWKEGRHREPLVLPFDMLTRALSAAEKASPPRFEATLIHKARQEMLAKRYIDSFRYSFLMLEALFGDGKFKTDQLKEAFQQSADLQIAIERALKQDLSKPRRPRHSDTEKLLANSPTPEAISDHLVEKRGFYFHGNVRRKGAWQPHAQDPAEALCLLALDIAHALTIDAAAPMFAADHSGAHFKNAEKVGAIMTLRVSFTHRDPPHDLDRKNAVDIRIPATKVTEKLAVYAAREFLNLFEDRTPHSNLREATCVVSHSQKQNRIVYAAAQQRPQCEVVSRVLRRAPEKLHYYFLAGDSPLETRRNRT